MECIVSQDSDANTGSLREVYSVGRFPNVGLRIICTDDNPMLTYLVHQDSRSLSVTVHGTTNVISIERRLKDYVHCIPRDASHISLEDFPFFPPSQLQAKTKFMAIIPEPVTTPFQTP